MTWVAEGVVAAVALSLVTACSGRIESASDPPASTSGGHDSVSSGGTSVGGASMPIGVGGMTMLTVPIDPEPSLATTCGNGQIDRNEQCDDGNKTRGDGCSALCQLEPGFACPQIGQSCLELYPCGNGVVDGKNACDDGNQTSGDGCDATCAMIEPGWQCHVPGRPCVPFCGDGVITGGEECDQGLSNGTFLQGQVVACSLGCTRVALCSTEEVTVNCPSACGDRLVDLDEQCDLGPLNDDAAYGGCTSRCQLGPYCGDGIVNGVEACDPGHDPVAIYGQPGCTAACQPAHYCGDGFVDTLFDEYCDGGQACDRTCSPYLGP